MEMDRSCLCSPLCAVSALCMVRNSVCVCVCVWYIPLYMFWCNLMTLDLQLSIGKTKVLVWYFLLGEGGYVFRTVYLCVCLSVIQFKELFIKFGG